jgi:hypothetical protein
VSIGGFNKTQQKMIFFKDIDSFVEISKRLDIYLVIFYWDSGNGYFRVVGGVFTLTSVKLSYKSLTSARTSFIISNSRSVCKIVDSEFENILMSNCSLITVYNSELSIKSSTFKTIQRMVGCGSVVSFDYNTNSSTSKLEITNQTLFTYCSASSGGCIYSGSKINVNISSARFYSCVATEGHGGAVLFNYNPVFLFVGDSEFNMCYSNGNGGALAFSDDCEGVGSAFFFYTVC